MADPHQTIRLVRPKTFEDVVDVLERHDARISLLVESEAATSAALGAVAVELANLRRSDDELRRAIVGSLPPTRVPMDTGSFIVVDAYTKLREAAADKNNPMSSDRVRAIAEKVSADMRAAAELSTWRRIKAMPGWAARKAAEKAIEWMIPLILGAVAVEVWRYLHR